MPVSEEDADTVGGMLVAVVEGADHLGVCSMEPKLRGAISAPCSATVANHVASQAFAWSIRHDSIALFIWPKLLPRQYALCTYHP